VDAKTAAFQRKRRKWAPEKMLSALAEARRPAQTDSLYSIAHDNKLPDTTFRRYFREGRTSIPAMGTEPIVKPTVEDRVVRWIGDRNFVAAPVPKALAGEKLKNIVQELHQQDPSQRVFQTPTGEPSKSVWRRLFRRNPEIRHRVPSRHSAATLRAILKPQTYTSFFGRVRDPLSRIRRGRRFTADEFSLSANKNNSKVLYVQGSGQCQALEASGYTAHVSLINNVCDDGTPLETVLLFGNRQENINMERLNEKVMMLGYTRK
jgi:hypothetical protein